MRVLPRGVIGFGSGEQVAFERFVEAVEDVAAALDTLVLERAPAEDGAAYHRVDIKRNGIHTTVMCNPVFPLVAVMHHIGLDSEFVDDAELRTAFKDAHPEFTVLCREDLERAADAEALADLDPRELEIIRYFEVETIGEIVFNTFD